MISRRSFPWLIAALLAGASAAHAAPPVATEIAIQGVARDASDFVLASGNLAVRVYADSLGSTALYDSGSQFAGAIQQGVFDVIAGRGVPLLLDPTQTYFLELDVAGVEVIGDAAGGRQRFHPMGGSRARTDLEARLSVLETAMGLGLLAKGGDATRAVREAHAVSAPPRLTSAFSNLHGMLGPGRASGVNGSYRVTADLLSQPVGIRGSGAVQAWLGPLFLSLPTPDPALRSVKDVPNDQGRSIRVRWRNDWRERAYDPSDPQPRITGYTLYRRVDAGQSLAAAARPASPERSLPPGSWDVLTTVPATLDSTYQTTVSTLCDSTDLGVCWSVFFVRSITDRVGTYHDSPADSGWSADNLAPGVPAGLVVQIVAGGTQLSWQASTASDFQYFRVYRSSDPQFTPSPSTLVHATATPGWLDPLIGGSTYKVTAVDANGNESPPAAATSTTGVEDREAAPRVLGFTAIAPNPFRGELHLAIEVPERAGPVTLALFDVSGRRLRALADGGLAPGRYTFTWDGRSDAGTRVAPGIFVARLTGAGRTLTRRVTFLP